MSHTSYTPRIDPPRNLNLATKPARKRSGRWTVPILLVLIFLLFFSPFRTNLLVICSDRTPDGTAAGRSDTMILTSLPPVLPQMRLLSIPRDLWVSIPGVGENRINTAHYFAELNQPGTGLKAAAGVVEANFGVKVSYVLRLKFDGFVNLVDAMGGVTVDLPSDMSGMTAGKHHLDGTQALAFVRDRSGSDDFFRQQRGQLFIAAAVKGMLNPAKWLRLPAVIAAFLEAVDSNVPLLVWPRLLYGLTFSAIKGFDSHAITREMTTSWTTDQGAQVLLPNWDLILPMVNQYFK